MPCTSAKLLNAPWDAFNLRLFEQMHASSVSPGWAVICADILTELPLYAMLAITLVWIWRARDRRAVAWLFLAFVAALGIELLISTFAYHARPFEAGCIAPLVLHSANNSMPSTHVAFTVIMTLVALGRRRWVIATVGAVAASAMAWARIYVGIHWPADMLGALLSGTGSVILAGIVLRISALVDRRVRAR